MHLIELMTLLLKLLFADVALTKIDLFQVLKAGKPLTNAHCACDRSTVRVTAANLVLGIPLTATRGS